MVTRVPQSTQAEMENAVETAKAAGRSWSKSSPMARCFLSSKVLLSKDSTSSRQQIMFKYQQLIKAHLDDIAKLITVEQVFYREREVQKRN